MLPNVSGNAKEAEGGEESGHHPPALLPGVRLGLGGRHRRFPGPSHHPRIPDVIRGHPLSHTQEVGAEQIHGSR